MDIERGTKYTIFISFILGTNQATRLIHNNGVALKQAHINYVMA